MTPCRRGDKQRGCARSPALVVYHPPPRTTPPAPPLEPAHPMSRLPAAMRREQLLETAAKVFAARGYSGTTTAELAKAAGVSEPIIYRHFDSKKELFIELVRKTSRDTIANWENGLHGLTDPAERLLRLLGSNPMVSPDGAIKYRVIVQAMTEVEDQEIQLALQDHIRALHEFLRAQIDATQASGVVPKRYSADLTAWLLIYLGLGYGTLSALHVANHGYDASGAHVDDVIGALMLGAAFKRRREGP